MLFEDFDDRAEVNRLIGKLAVFGDLGLVQNFEPVALKQLRTPPAVKGHHLRMDLFDALVVEITQVGFKEQAKDLDRLRRRKKVDVEMSNVPGSRRDFTPGF